MARKCLFGRLSSLVLSGWAWWRARWVRFSSFEGDGERRLRDCNLRRSLSCFEVRGTHSVYKLLGLCFCSSSREVSDLVAVDGMALVDYILF